MPPLCIAHIRSGDRVMIGGLTNFGCPLNLVYELAAHPEIRGLTLISEDVGWGGLPHKQAQCALIANDQVRELIVSFVGSNPDVNEAVQAGRLTLTLVPQGTLAERIRAAGAGIGGFYTPTGVGTVVEAGKEKKSSTAGNTCSNCRCTQTSRSLRRRSPTRWAMPFFATRRRTSTPSWPWRPISSVWRRSSWLRPARSSRTASCCRAFLSTMSFWLGR